MVSQLTLHVVGSEVSTAHDALTVDHVAFALLAIIHKLAVVDFLLCVAIEPSVARLLAVLVSAIIHVAGVFVEEATLVVFAIVAPAALVLGAVRQDHFTVAMLHKGIVLSEVDVAIRVHQFSNRVTDASSELPLKYNAARHEQHAFSVKFIVEPSASVYVTVLEPHFTLLTLVVPPVSSERATVSPRDRALSMATTCLEVTLVLSLLNNPVLPCETCHVLQASFSTRFAITETSLEFVLILKYDRSHTTQSISR